MKHKGTKKLEGTKIILRKFIKEDATSMYNNWANDTEVVKFLTWPAHESIEVSKNILNSWIADYDKPNFYQWAITLKDNETNPIGTISVVDQNESLDIVHVGYCIGKNWWNKGITSEALSLIIDFFINEVQANRIESRHDPRNPHSGKVMLKCGLKYEGTLVQADKNNQGICDASYYGLIAKDYNTLK